MNVRTQDKGGSDAGTDTRATLLVTVKGNQTVAFFDEASGELLAAPVVGSPEAKPHEIILSPDGRRAFATLYGDKGYPDSVLANKIAVIDVQSMKLEKTIGMDLYIGPHGLARDYNGRIWVTAEGNQCVLVVDPVSCEIARSVYTETRCHFIHPSRNGLLMYTAHKELPYIGVIDARSCKLIDKIDLDIGSQAIWHAPDRDLLYVGDFFRPQFHVVDTQERRVVRSVTLRGVPGWPYATPDGKHIVVSTYIEAEDRGFAEVFDAETLTPLSIVELPAEPFHVLDGADGRTVLIVVGDGRLVRMDIASGELGEKEYAVGAVMPEQVIRTHLQR